MERLTTKDYKNWIYGVGYQNKKDSKLRTKIEHKLGEFEDLLEEHNLDFNALKQIIEWLSELNGNDAEQMQFICQQRAKIFESNKRLEKENQALKDRWQKLKDIISQKQNIKNKSDAGLITLFGCIGVESFCKMLLDKMQELEKE